MIEFIVFKGEGENNKFVVFNFFIGKYSRFYLVFGFVDFNLFFILYFNKDVWDILCKIKVKGMVNYLRNCIVNVIGKVKKIGKIVCKYNDVDYFVEVIFFEFYKGDESSYYLVYYVLIKYELMFFKGIFGGLCKIKFVVL